MVPNKTYRITQPFTDYDGSVHDIGESWVFVSKNFLPYDDGLTLYIETQGKPGTIRMQWRDEAQGEVISNFSDYVEKI